MISVSGGRACRDRDGVARLAGRPVRVVWPRLAWRRLGRSMVCLRRGARGGVGGVLVGGLPRQQRRHLRRQAGACRLLCRRRRRGTSRRHAVIPARHPDQQHGRRREEHQREPLDERIAEVDQRVLDTGDLAAVEQEVRGRHGDEQDQRRLDDRGEDAGLPHREHREDASDRIRRRENHAQLFVAGAGVVGKADGGRRDRDQHRTPPRNTRDDWGAQSDGRPSPPTVRAVLTQVDRTGSR